MRLQQAIDRKYADEALCEVLAELRGEARVELLRASRAYDLAFDRLQEAGQCSFTRQLRAAELTEAEIHFNERREIARAWGVE